MNFEKTMMNKGVWFDVLISKLASKANEVLELVSSRLFISIMINNRI